MKRPLYIALVVATAILAGETAFADIVSVSVNSSTLAQIDLEFDSDSATALSSTYSSFIRGTVNSTLNSETTSSLDYSWNGSTLSGSSLAIAEKLVNAKPGGQHTADSLFEFDFVVDSDTRFFLNGSFGFLRITGVDDSISFSLVGPGTSIAGSPTSTNAGINGDTFSETGIIGPGSYTLTFSIHTAEAINQADSRQAGWTLNQFTLVAVPEPVAILPCSLAMLAALTLRRRK